MTKEIFAPAVAEVIDKPIAFWGPESFQDYIKRNNLPSRKTAPWISVDSQERLSPFLREHDVMVLRLGASKGTGTQFGLVRCEEKLDSYFLIDDELFGGSVTEVFLPTASFYELYPFHLIGAQTEAALVNFGFASGLFEHALRLEGEGNISAPATGSSSYTFTVRPNSQLDISVEHKAGQVQIDALFIGKRENSQILFILEAKAKGSDKSLAKHKLVYPILALAENMPPDMPIVPVYMKALKEKKGLHFLIAECRFPDPRRIEAGIDELTPVRCCHLFVPPQAAGV